MDKKIDIAQKQVRTVVEVLSLKSAKDGEDQVLEFSFSSEVPYRRWYGFEIISHENDAINMERLAAGAPLLFNHDWDKHIGIVEKAWIGDDRRGHCQVRFSKNSFAQEKLQDAKDGILKGVSFGYMINEMKLTKESDEGDEYTVSKCTPYEISLVTVPADFSVGVGRSEDEKGEMISIVTKKSEPVTEPIIEPVQENIQTPNPAVRTAFQGGKMEPEQAKSAEKLRIQTIRALGEKFNKPELAASLIDGDKTIDEARSLFLEQIGMTQKSANGTEAEIGLSEKEKNKFSFVRAIFALANPRDARAQEAAKFELECSTAAAMKAGKEARGIMIPLEMLRHVRDLSVGTSTAGGHTVATELQAGSFIDILRKKMVLMRAGAQFLSGLQGNIAIPRQTGAATSYWVGEGSAPTESQQVFDQVTMSPKTIGAFTDFSRKLILQSSLDVESMVKNDLASVLALGIDLAGLYGSGSSNQPTGLVGVSGLNIVDLAAATPTFAEMVAMETAIASDNADVENMKYLLNAAGRGALKGKEKSSGYPQYVFENGQINGYGSEVSNQIAAGDFFFGNWADLMIGMWSGLDLTVDPYAAATSGTVRVIALQDVDVAARHGESFCRAYEVP
jgi:HK97 family phage major capsid protein/HK97 family phage prohead protease